MNKIVYAYIIIVMSIIIFGCTNAPDEAVKMPAATPILVLSFRAEGSLKDNSQLYAGPGTEYAEIGMLPKEASVLITGTSTDILWYLTYYDNQPAWLPAGSVEISLQTVQGQVGLPTFTSVPPDAFTPVSAIASSTPSPTRYVMSSDTPPHDSKHISATRTVVVPTTTRKPLRPAPTKPIIVQPAPTQPVIVQPAPTKPIIIQPKPTIGPIIQPTKPPIIIQPTNPP